MPFTEDPEVRTAYQVVQSRQICCSEGTLGREQTRDSWAEEDD
jgi:hypothetical protein